MAWLQELHEIHCVLACAAHCLAGHELPGVHVPSEMLQMELSQLQVGAAELAELDFDACVPVC